MVAKLESRNQVFGFTEQQYAGFWGDMGFSRLHVSDGDKGSNRGGASLMSVYRWHPIPGVYYGDRDPALADGRNGDNGGADEPA
jgi:hypothetical protein